MPWTARMIQVEFRTRRETWGSWEELVDVATGRAPVVGDMYYAPWYLTNPRERAGIAPHYWARPEPRRAPLVLICPGMHSDGRSWCLDQLGYNKDLGGWHGAGWVLTGVEPHITASPSINLVGDYHGHLAGGVLSADVEGRTFPPRPIHGILDRPIPDPVARPLPVTIAGSGRALLRLCRDGHRRQRGRANSDT